VSKAYTRLHDDLFAADTPRKMRAAIELSGFHHPIIRRCLDSARFQGFNGEDTMTFLAAHLALENEHIHKALLKQLECSMAPMFIVKPEGVR
jgi:hypothetical protein